MLIQAVQHLPCGSFPCSTEHSLWASDWQSSFESVQSFLQSMITTVGIPEVMSRKCGLEGKPGAEPDSFPFHLVGPSQAELQVPLFPVIDT